MMGTLVDLPGASAVQSTIRTGVDPVVRPLGYVRDRGAAARWADGHAAGERTYFWVQVHPKAKDPYSGGEFLVEFERSSAARPAAKLSGRARFDQLLTGAELETILEHQNDLIASLPRPPASHVASYPPDLRQTYLQEFEPQGNPSPGNLWLRYQTLDHIHGWLRLIRGLLPSLLARAKRLDPHVVYLGSKIDLDADPLRPTNPLLIKRPPEE